MEKPSVFIGSSSEGLEFARAARSALSGDAEVAVWDEVFPPSNTFIESLMNAVQRFDFAVLVFRAEDWVESRSHESFGPRDNVIFELGLFMGHLGRSRTFILHQTNTELKIPTDLSGVTTATYEWPRTDQNHRSAVGAACDRIREAIRDLGISDTKASKQIGDIKVRQDDIESQVRTLQLLVKALVTEFEFEKLCGLAKDGPFMVRFHNDMLEELKRLDAIRYVQPQQGYGIESIRQRDGHSDEFDIKQYVRITEEGREYLGLREALLQRPLS